MVSGLLNFFISRVHLKDQFFIKIQFFCHNCIIGHLLKLDSSFLSQNQIIFGLNRMLKVGLLNLIPSIKIQMYPQGQLQKLHLHFDILSFCCSPKLHYLIELFINIPFNMILQNIRGLHLLFRYINY